MVSYKLNFFVLQHCQRGQGEEAESFPVLHEVRGHSVTPHTRDSSTALHHPGLRTKIHHDGYQDPGVPEAGAGRVPGDSL